MPDKYASFHELTQHEICGRDYRVSVVERSASPVLVVAPHGGSIEIGTSEIAALIAGEDHNLFTFDGLKPLGTNRDLHITSHRFDHPECLALASRCTVTVGVHGCKGESHIYIGGLDTRLTGLLCSQLNGAGFPASTDGHRYAGRHPENICNRSARGCGAQLELTKDFRDSARRLAIASSVREAIAEHLETTLRYTPWADA
jgi:phage replication-related protein YjqB (UPF0714/DUF867 family)